nr:hypothetical protein [Tanacetum cinerariifolium]
HAVFVEEFVGRQNLAAGDAGQVADHAFDFGDAVAFQPLGEWVFHAAVHGTSGGDDESWRGGHWPERCAGPYAGRSSSRR